MGRVQTPRHELTAFFFVGQPKSDREQIPSGSQDGGVCLWPEIGNFLVIPYGFHGVGSHDEGRVVARSRQRFRLRGRGKNGCPRKRTSSIGQRFPHLLGPHQNVKKARCVREATSFHLSDAVVVSCCEDPAVRQRRESGNEVRVSFSGYWCHFACRIV